MKKQNLLLPLLLLLIAACNKDSDDNEATKTVQKETETATTQDDNDNHQGWIKLNAPPPNLTHHAYGFSFNEKGYLVGGNIGGETSSTYSKAFYEYNPTTDEWTQLDDYAGPARGFGIGDQWNGKAYYGFGITNGEKLLSDLWEYDPSTQEWKQLADCPC